MSTNPYKNYQNKCAVLGIHPVSNSAFNKLINSNKTPAIVGKQGSGKTILVQRHIGRRAYLLLGALVKHRTRRQKG